MSLRELEISGFKSFGKKTKLLFDAPIVAIVGPNGSGKSNVAEAFRWVLGEQSLKSLRGKRGEDLIYNGGGTGSQVSRAQVSIVFDNQQRHWPFDYDEIRIARQVFRDGVNEYTINGSVVRLRDIQELMAKMSLGPSGHQIISQGEADRVLSSSPEERRQLLEEALGLKIYEWQLAESEKKLQKTEENIRQTESIRREIAPHLRFLKKQVEKMERTIELRRQLKVVYLTYLRHERFYLDKQRAILETRQSLAEIKLKDLRASLGQVSDDPTKRISDELLTKEQEIKNNLKQLESEQFDLLRQLGKLEGLLEATNLPASPVIHQTSVSFEEYDQWRRRLIDELDSISRSLASGEVVRAKQIIDSVVTELRQASRAPVSSDHNKTDQALIIAQLRQEQEQAKKILEQRITELRTKENFWHQAETENLAEQKSLQATMAERDRQQYERRVQLTEAEADWQRLLADQQIYQQAEEAFARELEEGAVLVDREIFDYHQQILNEAEAEQEDRSVQEDRRYQLEKLKIRLEDAGGESGDVLNEYRQVADRDEHLATELTDLKHSADSLKQIMLDLRDKLNREFNSGLHKINQVFNEFFNLVFGGGEAGLVLLTNHAESHPADWLVADQAIELPRQGVEINVSLPRKKIRSLAMLSGGERALTSIALLFAMSQVNPPPFLILDETDAALDEANSRKYGEMIDRLSKQSQLILVTHNRETMSRAGILYGVTMGSDACSRLLSIRLAEATAYAK